VPHFWSFFRLKLADQTKAENVRVFRTTQNVKVPEPPANQKKVVKGKLVTSPNIVFACALKLLGSYTGSAAGKGDDGASTAGCQ